jgi:anti-sigma factor RsiW
VNRLAHPIPAEWLTAYYDGELDAARRGQVQAHLPECAECRRELEDMNALGQALARDGLPQEAFTGPAAFWRGVQRQLPNRQPAQPALARVSTQRVLLRWSPGIGLLLLNGLVQVAAVAGTVLLLMTWQLSTPPAWAAWIYRLAASATLGWLAWLLPANWGGLGLFLFWVTVSGALALLYMAWLGYELRYGALTTVAGATA